MVQEGALTFFALYMSMTSIAQTKAHEQLLTSEIRLRI